MANTANSTRSTVHVVVTCSNRKRYAVPTKLRLRELQERAQERRFATWTRRLGADEPSIPAAALYGGEHWQVASRLPSVLGDTARLWVCSAGYGLVAADTHLNPYAATFSSGSPDSVGDTAVQVQDWWRRLTDWAGPRPNQPRSFEDLARRDPAASIVVVLSEAYIRACTDDLLNATDQLRDRDRFAVIGPAKRGTAIDEFVVPVTARLRSVVGGSLQALHARVAAHLFVATSAHNAALSRARLQRAARQATVTAPPDPSRRVAGIRLSDEDVRSFIRLALTSGPTTATALLRCLRDSGQSCEQSRFKRLFADTVAEGAQA